MANTKKLKIGLILDTSLDPNDGVQQYVVGLGEWLRKQGHNVHYLVGQSEHRQLPNIHSLARNVTVRFNGNRTTIPLWLGRKKAKQLINSERFDILHVQMPHHPLLAQRLILAAGPQTAVVGTFHVLPYGRAARLGNRLLGFWLRPSIQRLDSLLAVSSVAAEFAASSFGVKAVVLPNVINYSLFHKAQPFTRYHDSTPTILFLGRLVPRKGCATLLQAVAELAQSGPKVPDFRVVICGAGALESSLVDYTKSHHLERKVEFTGYVNEADKPRYYASADIAVFPSSAGESFGIVLLEAMAGKAEVVIGGDNPGYRTVLGDQPETLFDPKNPQALAKVLLELLQNKQLVNRLHVHQQQTVKDYDINNVGAKILDVYYKAIAKRRLSGHN